MPEIMPAFPIELTGQSTLKKWVARWPDGTVPGMGNPVESGNFAVVRLAYEYEGEAEISVDSSVSNFLHIPHDDVMYLYSLQGNDEAYTAEQRMNKWCQYKGRPYMFENSDDDWRTAPSIRWGCLLIGGNLVLTDKVQTVWGDNGVKKGPYEAARIVCMRRWDMQSQNPSTAPFLFHILNSVNDAGDHIYSPFGRETRSPVWSPLDWDKNGSRNCIALWAPTAFLEAL